MQDFKTFKVWQKAHSLALVIYKSTDHFPSNELYGLTSQMRRACTSITANIAEGCGREGRSEFARFLQIAMGSAYELECHLLLARDLNYIKNEDYENLNSEINEVRKMLTALIKKLQAASTR